MTARIAISIGCPCGIGPEVSALAAIEAAARVVLVGSWRAVDRAVKTRGIDAGRFVRVARAEDAWTLPTGRVAVWSPVEHGAPGKWGHPRAADGAAQLAWVDAACDLVSSGGADAMVTGPVSKEVIASSPGKAASRFLGHTEHLQRRLGAREVIMAFWNERFTTSLVTTHVPLARVPRMITARAVATSTYWLARLLLDLREESTQPLVSTTPLRSSGRAVARVAVCSLNPHAGEGGLLGGEEKRAIAPGIARAVARLAKPRAISIEGPVGAETAFRRANARVYDGVVAMYHDQATVPTKLVGFGESVNVSLGLPIVRTSVDHGTGYDIAGKGVADARGMSEAIALAVRLSAGGASSGT